MSVTSIFADLPDDNPIRFTTGSDVGMVAPESIYHRLLPVGALTLLCGREGVGKSMFAAYVLALASRDRVPNPWGGPMNVLVVGTEDSFNSGFLPRFVAAGGDPDRIFAIEDESDIPLSRPDVLDYIAQRVDENDIRIIYADHLSALVPTGTSSKDYDAIGGALRRLNKWAERLGVVLLGGWHLTKGNGDVADKVIGSGGGVQGAARAVLMLCEKKDTHDVFVALTKANGEGTNRSPLAFSILTAPVPMWNPVRGEEVVQQIPYCHNVHSVSSIENGKDFINMLFALDSKGERSEEDGPDAVDAWLLTLLSESGGSKRDYVFGMGEHRGYSESTIKRAFARIGGVSHRVGKEAVWSLPAAPQDIVDRHAEPEADPGLFDGKGE